MNLMYYVFIDGEGRNSAMSGQEPKYKYTVSYVVPEGSPAHKHLVSIIDAEWEDYKQKFNLKGRPKTNGIKLETMADPKGTIDPETEEIKRIPTGNIIASFKTNTTWPDGKPQIVKVFDHKGTDITEAFRAASWSIGNGSTGVIHGSAVGNNVGGTHKVTLYLSAVQLAKLVKYEGDTVDADEIEGEDLDLGDAVTAIPDEEHTPNLD